MKSNEMAKRLVWTESLPYGWSVKRIKMLFHDDTKNISIEQLASLEVDHYSIPAFDEFYAPVSENGSMIGSNKKLLQGGELLFSKLNSHKPRLWLVPINGNIKVASTEFIALSEWYEKSIDKTFARYLLGSIAFTDYISCFQTSVTNSHKRIRPEDLWSKHIPYPPLPDQELISAFLDTISKAIEAAVIAKQRQLEILDALDRVLLHTAFMNNNWPIERIKDIAIKIGSGITPEGGAAGYLEEGIPLLRSQNIHFDGLHLEDVAFISEETHNEMASSQLKPRDVLLNITGASIGRCTFVPEDFGEGNVNQHVCIIRGNHKIDYRFLAAYISSPMGQGQVLSAFTGASREGLSQKELGLISIPLPSCDIQKQVVSSLEKERSNQKQVRNNIESQITILTAYRKSLIHECVTGQRRVTNADLSPRVTESDLVHG